MSDVVLLDASAAMALVNPTHSHHLVVRERCQGYRLGLAGRAALDLYSVLTRAPAPQRLTPAAAHRLITHNFPATMTLSPPRIQDVLTSVAERELTGGAVHDAAVGLAAQASGLPFLTCDPHAAHYYELLGVSFELIVP